MAMQWIDNAYYFPNFKASPCGRAAAPRVYTFTWLSVSHDPNQNTHTTTNKQKNRPHSSSSRPTCP